MRLEALYPTISEQIVPPMAVAEVESVISLRCNFHNSLLYRFYDNIFYNYPRYGNFGVCVDQERFLWAKSANQLYLRSSTF